MGTAGEKEFSLEELGDTGKGKTVICEIKNDFYPYYFICGNCGYGKNGEKVYWYGFSSVLPENCFIIICLNCEKIIAVDLA